MIDIKKIRELVKLMVSNDLTELDLEGDNERVTLKRGLASQNVQYVAAPTHAPPAPNPAAPAQPTDAPAPAPGPTPEEQGLLTITSPMVGTYYSAASPDAKPFVTRGDPVDPETLVCIIEAMKVFNEIKAETNGTIEKVLVEAGQAVEFGQPLFLVRPNP